MTALPRQAPAPTTLRRLLLGPILSVVFVLMWTSGFVVGPIGVAAAPPLALTFWRMVVASAVMVAVSLVTKAPWPRGRAAWAQLIVTGILMQGVMFSGAYIGFSLGLSAGLAALINGTFPIIVAAAGVFVLKERLSAMQWVGTVLGFAGIAVAVSGELDGTSVGIGALLALLGTAGLSAGTLIQRRSGAHLDLRTGAVVQLAAAAVFVAPLAVFDGGLAIPVNLTTVASIGWLAIGNSALALGLMFVMLRHRTAADTTRRLLLVPPLTALIAWPVLGQTPHAIIWLGLVVTVTGIAIASRQPRTKPRLAPDRETVRQLQPVGGE
ncbi:MAG: DMT family transporter [Stackebrandtia sp.]